jgi:ABC-type Zn2+ transport system substrate-binding protein/surface adhesin
MSQSEDRLERLVDQEEAEFTMDKEVPPDQDAKLFSIADGLIRNQLAQVNVPLMGVLNFDESESESEEEEEEEEADEEDEMEGDDFDEDMQEDEEEDDDYDDDEIQQGLQSSQYVHVSSGKGTGRRTQSTASS